jgi:hypothetical protein
MDITDFTEEELQKALDLKLAERAKKQQRIEEEKARVQETVAQAASARISIKLEAVEALLAECVAIAEEGRVSFHFSPAYGMGGTYTPHPKEGEPGWDSSGCSYSDNGDYGWVSSSSNC